MAVVNANQMKKVAVEEGEAEEEAQIMKKKTILKTKEEAGEEARIMKKAVVAVVIVAEEVHAVKDKIQIITKVKELATKDLRASFFIQG